MNSAFITRADRALQFDDGTPRPPEYTPLESPQARRWKRLLLDEYQRTIASESQPSE